jgi:oxalate/formate antiporter
MSATLRPTAAVPVASTRWVQLGLGLVCMMAISSPQYVWALFTKPIGATLGATAAGVQVTFSILVVLQTFFSPFQGWLVERFGPRWLIAAGAGLTGLSWVLAASATSLAGLYLTYGLLGGLGTGIVYIGVVGQMVGWFPDRRGFAAGMVAAGYGMGAIVTTFPIADSLAADGWQATLLKFGLIFGAVGVLAALGLRAPPAAAAQARLAGGAADVETASMLRSPIFWLMFAMMSMMSTSGLMVTSQIGAFAGDFGIAKLTVWGFAALPLALTIDRFCNGLTRPFFGWVSDRIGRENTMALAFGLEGLAMAAWLATAGNPVLFVLMSGVVFFGWGEIFSLFPATLTDTFGRAHATKNYGCLYIAQGIGAIFGGPMASLLHDSTGSWSTVFGLAIGADLLTTVLAIAVLKPMRAAAFARSARQP